jgi:peptidyl-prolyl cis-trans isomerase D
MASSGKNAKKPAVDTKKDTEKPRKSNTNRFVYIGTIVILVITIISFVFLPSNSAGNASSHLIFGTYEGKPIEYLQGGYFANAASSLNDQLKQQGYDQSNYQLYAYQVWRGAFEQTAQYLAIMADAKRLGLTVSEKKIDDLLTEYAGFQENGRFSVQKYREKTASEIAQLRKSYREDTISQNYVSDMYGAKTSTKEIDFVKAMPSKERSIAYAAFPFSGYPDSEVKAYAETNKGLFRKIKLSRITVTKSEAEAKKTREKVGKDPSTFPATAKSESKDNYAESNGEYGWKYAYELRGDFEKKEDVDSLLALKQGEISPVFKASSEGWVFFRIEEAVLEPDFAQPDTLAAVKGYLESEEKGKIEDYLTKKAAEFKTAATKGFDSACLSFQVKKQVVDSFPLNYGDMVLFKKVNSQSLSELSGASTNEKFLTSVFSLKVNEISEPLVMNDSVLVFKVLEDKVAEESTTSIVGMYYSYIQQQLIQEEFKGLILGSSKLKDNFSNVFFAKVMPQESSK